MSSRPSLQTAMRTVIEALADKSKVVRDQALAALMRQSGTVPDEIISLLMNFGNAKSEDYFSKAHNGQRRVPTTNSTLALTALAFTDGDATDLVLQHLIEFPAPPSPDDFFNPEASELGPYSIYLDDRSKLSLRITMRTPCEFRSGDCGGLSLGSSCGAPETYGLPTADDQL